MTKQKAIDKVIKALDNLKEIAPDTPVCIETDHGTVTCRIGDALIYDGMDGSVMIDAE